MKNFIKNNWILLVILLLAFCFRFWQIANLPGGLFPDEAANGLDVNNILHGQIQPFYERGNGREALFFYFEAFSVLLFGRGVWQFHIVSAAFGFGAVIALYFLTKRMFGKNIALLATFFMAISSYATTVTRTAFRANTIPLITTLTLLFLVKFFAETENKKKYLNVVLAGVFFALGFYTYGSFRMMVPLLIGFGALLFLGNRNQARELFRIYTKYKVVFAASFLVVISWILNYFWQHPGSFVGRAGQVSIFNPDLNNGSVITAFLDVFKKTILAFFTEGDLNWRHNVSGLPFLAPLLSPFFALGLIFCTVAIFKLLKQVWQKNIEPNTAYQSLVACWFWFMLVPEITTAEGIPHGLRLTGIIPSIFILSALGVNWLWQRMPHNKHVKLEKVLVSVLFLATLLFYNYVAYFAIAAHSPEYYYAFRSDLTTVSNYLNLRNMKQKTYLSLDKFSVQTTDYLTSDYNQPYILVDPAHSFEAKLQKDDQIVFTQSTIFDSKKFMEYHPKARLVKEEKNKFGDTIMLVYQE